ncbi:hypothetical protein [Rodentibacter ratti]|uniref:Transferrin-binding protein B C-lobe/N-lobe beta barrel domain-containing protein n=1 Tax=Rodentibacter ratti TaxID=1906745 RepID=A0A1V3L8U8_9PAST|nr:hypothetical protein [Rodentibacter ratti]OOF86325.1 hypothetical protein BKG88_05705 [Rodentibacter ratti]
MNVTMKKTAAAMIVALMLAGCSSNDGDYFSRQSESQGQTQPTQPVQPEQPTEPSQPSQPTQPVQPEQPTEPSQPVQPTQPEQPSKPTQPVQPEQPTEPSQPTQPTHQPEKPDVNLEGKEWRNWSSAGTASYTTKIRGYAKGYDGPQGDYVLSEQNIEYFKDLDFYQIAKQDKNNPNIYGWHEGAIENEGIQGIEIKGLEFTNSSNGHNITQAIYPEKFNYIFKNTPYATYGALFTNEHDVMIFTTRGSSAIVGESEDAYSIGKYRVNNKGVTTNRIDFVDEVKGSATYKGEVLAHTLESRSNNGTPFEYHRSLPFNDGEITINAHFGTRPEDSFTTATLNSKTLGVQQFDKSRMEISDKRNIEFSRTNSSGVRVEGIFIGKNAAEAVGSISYDSGAVYEGNNTYRSSKYEAVFSAEKQPK